LNAREKLATGFVLTNQRDKAIAMLEEIIKKQPAKYQPYELLAQLFDEGGRAAERANQPEQRSRSSPRPRPIMSSRF